VLNNHFSLEACAAPVAPPPTDVLDAAAAEIWDRRAECRRRRQFMVAAGVSRRRL